MECYFGNRKCRAGIAVIIISGCKSETGMENEIIYQG